MKRLFFIIPLFFLFLFSFSSTSFAEGQACCNYPFSYDQKTNACCNGTSCNYKINCSSSEKCDPNSLKCIDATTPTSTPVIKKCCPENTHLENGTGMCYSSNNIAIIAWSCTATNSYCDSDNTCQIMAGPTIHETAVCGHTSNICCSSPVNKCDTDLNCHAVSGRGELCINKGQCELLNGCSDTPLPTFTVFCEVNGVRKEENGVETALGCIKVQSGSDLISSILRVATGVGGGLALALILYGVFIITTSAGNPDKLKSGSEIITSAVIGLVFILLSIFLVNLIGINILGLPGLS